MFEEGYIAEQSGHSRGSTVDLTLVRTPAAAAGALPPRRPAARLRRAAGERFRDNSIDMGTGYDCFDPHSHPFSARVTASSAATGCCCARAMFEAGFNGLETEWWHFTLRNEPFPERSSTSRSAAPPWPADQLARTAAPARPPGRR